MFDESTPTKFTPLQQELLKLYGSNVSEDDLIAIKDLIGKYFLNKLQDKADKAVDKLGYAQNDFDNWLNDPEQ